MLTNQCFKVGGTEGENLAARDRGYPIPSALPLLQALVILMRQVPFIWRDPTLAGCLEKVEDDESLQGSTSVGS